MCARTLVALLALASCPAWAAGNPDAARGLLADRCAACHAIPGYGDQQTTSGLPAPDFLAIANDQAVYTEERLRNFLRKPHWPMAGFILSPSDIDNILAYLATLRDS